MAQSGGIVSVRISPRLRAQLDAFAARNGLKTPSSALRMCADIVTGTSVTEAFVASRVIAVRAIFERKLEDIFQNLRQDMLQLVREELGEDEATPLPETLPVIDDDEDLPPTVPNPVPPPVSQTAYPRTTVAPELEPMDPTATMTGLRKKPARPRRRGR